MDVKVRSYTRKGKNGKTYTVKAHTRKARKGASLQVDVTSASSKPQAGEELKAKRMSRQEALEFEKARKEAEELRAKYPGMTWKQIQEHEAKLAEMRKTRGALNIPKPITPNKPAEQSTYRPKPKPQPRKEVQVNRMSQKEMEDFQHKQDMARWPEWRKKKYYAEHPAEGTNVPKVRKPKVKKESFLSRLEKKINNKYEELLARERNYKKGRR